MTLRGSPPDPADPRQGATLDTIPGPGRYGDPPFSLWDASNTASGVLAIAMAFQIPVAAATAGLIAAGNGSISAADILLDLLRFAWNGSIATLFLILAPVSLALVPLTGLLAIAALVELARPGQSQPGPQRSGESPWK